MNDTDDESDVRKAPIIPKDVYFIKDETTLKDPDLADRERPHDDPDSEIEDHEFAAQPDGNPSPAELKLKTKKALLEFRCKVEDSILGNYLLGESEQKHSPGEKVLAAEKLREIALWGIPLLPSKAHEGTDSVLLKFLKAKDFCVADAFEMLQKTMIWRKENNIDTILDEDLDSEYGKFMYINSRDREGRPVCYFVYGVFRNKELCKKTFGTEKERDKFLRWRIQFMEKSMKKLNFREGGVYSIVQIIDLHGTPKHVMKELNSVSKKTLPLFQSYYPETIYREIVVNAPFWFYTSQLLFSRFMSHKSEKEFMLARPPRATQTLLKFIAPEHLPVEYGGLKRENDQDFSPGDKTLEHKIRGNTMSTIEIPVNEPGVTLIWDVTVVGWEVSYKEEFIPEDEGSYTILLQNQKRMGDSIRNSFYINEPGKIVITVGNGTFKKKRMFYRSKAVTTVPMFIFFK
ncbi:patellin-4-like [Neltuma alba]|uniref:patellin-4-like n=1 Tax=Neltuma alba TaxID=207710 RepID=UPI0010A4EAB0|nr:patellin-4-like [Prosopis alba]